MSYIYVYPRPAVTIDVILITIGKNPKVLLIERKHDPHKGCWAFPGGFVDMDEDLITAAQRELYEETNVGNIELSQFKTYGTPERDPRGRTISVVYYAFVNEEIKTKAGDDAEKATWFDLNNVPTLAFDHELILNEFKEAKLFPA